MWVAIENGCEMQESGTPGIIGLSRESTCPVDVYGRVAMSRLGANNALRKS